MFSRSWCAAIALGLMACGLAPSIAAGQSEPQKPPVISQPDDSQKPASQPPVAEKLPIEPSREQPEKTQWKNPNCPEPNSKDEADLCQQIRMAVAAEDSRDIARAQLWISLLVAALVFMTWWYTKKAADGAMIAAKAGIDTVAKTEDANRIVRQVERPYLIAIDPFIISELSKSIPPNPPKMMCALGFKIQNCGKGPAFIELVEAELRDGNHVSHVARRFFRVAMEQETIEVPDHGGRAGFEISVFEASFGNSPTRSCQMNFTIHYRDVFGTNRTTKSGYRRNPFRLEEPLITASPDPKDWRDEEVGKNA